MITIFQNKNDQLFLQAEIQQQSTVFGITRLQRTIQKLYVLMTYNIKHVFVKKVSSFEKRFLYFR